MIRKPVQPLINVLDKGESAVHDRDHDGHSSVISGKRWEWPTSHLILAERAAWTSIPMDILDLAFEIWSLSHGVAMLSVGGYLETGPAGPSPSDVLRRACAALVDAAVRRHRTRTQP